MADAAHYFGSDLAIGPTGDIALATGALAVQQRIVRRLLTSPGDYIWHPEYGAGLPAMVGQPVNASRIEAIIRAQVLLDEGVARTPAPRVTVTSTPNGTVTASITYADAATGATQLLTVPVN